MPPIEHRFLIVGTGRCGTGWASRFMDKIGYFCGHEAAYNPLTLREVEAGIVPQPRWIDGMEGDSSWLAVPYIEGFLNDNPDNAVVHLVRNPVDVFQSLLGIGFLSLNGIHSPYDTFARYHMDVNWKSAESRDDLIDRNVYFMEEWYRRLAEREDDAQVFAVEDLQRPRVAMSFVQALIHEAPSQWKVEKALNRVPTDVNARPRAVMQAKEIPAKINKLAKEFGYA